ncbi:YncE family protein, partial [Escherichia coli]|nr:YncE family protein [Escherichia coli]
IYLPAATLAAPEAGAKRGKPVPGSFVVLVLAPVRS